MRGYGHATPRVLDRGHQQNVEWAHQVNFTWDQNVETNIARYWLYAGTTSEDYSAQGSPKDMGNNTCGSFTISTPGRWYFALSAENSFGLESDLSDEVTGYFA